MKNKSLLKDLHLSLFINNVINKSSFYESLKTLMLRVFGVLLLLGFTIFLTNTYPIEIVGQFDFVRSYLLVLGCIAMLGTDQSILFFAGYLKSKDSLYSIKQIYKRMIFLILISSVILLIVFVIVGEKNISLFFKDEKIFSILLKSNFILFFYAITLFNTEVLRSLDNIYLSELFRNTFKYITVILGSFILVNVHKENLLVDVFLLSFGLLSLISLLVVLKKFKKIDRLKIDYKIKGNISYRNIFLKSYPIALSSTAIFLLTSFDIFFLKINYGNNIVAKYSIGVKMMTIIAMVIQMINVNMSSKVAKLYIDSNYVELQKILQSSVRIISILSIPIVIIICLFAENILNLFGSNFIDAKNAMIILVLSQGFVSFFGVSSMYLNMTERQKTFQFLLIFAVILNYTLNFVLTPKFGMEGAATSFAITILFWNIFVAIYVFKKDNIKIYIH